MKHILFVAIIAFLTTGVAYGASNLIKTSKQWGEVKSTAQTVEVFQLRDNENGVICYYSFIKGNAGTPPVVSCVTVK